MNVQLLFLAGRATKDAELMTSKNDKKYVKFSIAINEYNKSSKEEKVNYYDAIILDKTAEKAAEIIKKGDAVTISGKPEFEAYISTKDNEPKCSITIIADSWKVIK